VPYPIGVFFNELQIGTSMFLRARFI